MVLVVLVVVVLVLVLVVVLVVVVLDKYQVGAEEYEACSGAWYQL